MGGRVGASPATVNMSHPSFEQSTPTMTTPAARSVKMISRPAAISAAPQVVQCGLVALDQVRQVADGHRQW